ncbi:hypothetical protein U4959_10320 [Acinetobacter junii]|jgi:hypothetical protein|uniref:Uncharacterized protein n=1 Tax=Acinetobacter junii TaxID=40215 RepID=A0ABU8ZBW3_ACIJU|nr:hypothetical protein [Acinetobacter junii]APU48289.1 hypothetical protein BVL33_07140 [Acinetobacter junii]MCU4405964.1 hypothetical protein [Acinetobacter junii]MDH0666753.1 hypothetical protein [Acinetobacter junii]MDH1857806.1 hypothetical protein [Acinetobacter junii]MEB8380627.1 hypothetical protein [Acinetobacter junii]|eukprot:TRINITY_DN5405_c0_g1_i1.p1 TRINITY_DN5405_c0_g1~~TRINITY_DN5405_c0_g1_i1.p1  ORF type:complete len:263 (+),score=37.46 TRINITY_DN5405_c0_g1_i1:770-1558(+)
MTYQYHDETIITELPKDTVFVFGSNLAGIHDTGAARIAAQHFAAVKGVGRGWAGQSFAIPTLNEHLQQMPLPQIEHYVNDFKIYTKNHPKMKYFVTALGCGSAGYKFSEIAPLFEGISNNVIFPQSFKPYLEPDRKRLFPTLTQEWVKAFIKNEVIFFDEYGYESYEEALNTTSLSPEQQQIALQILKEPMYPCDRYDRGREYEINDTLKHLSSLFNFDENDEKPMIFIGTIIALMELYEFDEDDFIHLWNGDIQIDHSVNR